MPVDRKRNPGRRTRNRSAASAAAAALAWTCAAFAGPPYAGRPLRDVLAEFGQQGLHLVYSSETVPASLRVAREPAPGPAIDTVRELLAEHGLEARSVGESTYSVVRKADPAPAAAVPPPAPRPAAAPLEEIVVAASRFSLSAAVPDARTVFTQAEIEGLPRLADDSLKAVHRLPGAASNGVSGLAYMRGGDTNETLVVLDGFPLYEPFHLKVLLSPTSLLDPAILSGVDVHAGGFTADFGDRMSAVIEATSIHPDADEHYELGLSLFNANLLAFNRFGDGRGQWLVSARRSNLDEIADLLDAQYGELTYSDAFARLDWEFTPATRGSLHVLLSKDEADVTNSQETESASADYRNTYAWGTVEHEFSPRLSSRAIASYTYVSTERTGEVDEDGIRTGAADDRRHYDVLGLILDASYRGERWLARWGGEARSLEANYDYASVVRFEPDYPFPGSPGRVTVNDLDPEPSGAHYAAWLSTRLQLAPPLTAEIGLRWDDETYGPQGGNQVAPRVNLLYEAGPRTRLRASWGRYQQAQGINELQVEDGVDRFFRPQYAFHQILGLEQGLSQGFTLRLEGYVKDYESLRPRFESLYDPTSLVPELRWDRVEIWPTSARAEGVELLLTRKSDSPWNGWFNYAWSRVTDREGGTDTRRSWDQTNNLGAGLTWAEAGWQATLAATYHTGWPTTPLRFVAPGGGTGEWVAGPRNADRLPAFASVDVRVSRDFRLRRGTLNVFAEATNLLNRGNPCCTDFSFEPTSGGGTELEREYRDWLPLVPNVGVLWKF
jgi:hypothetical protein